MFEGLFPAIEIKVAVTVDRLFQLVYEGMDLLFLCLGVEVDDMLANDTEGYIRRQTEMFVGEKPQGVAPHLRIRLFIHEADTKVETHR